ncbi:PIR Superfamily Protein [Plasmodium ovale wallikeri]|uniref:PIR Superfamily Protein n=2 Tax=Plasmodium ovale TaxID=36330 RepID=A0A1A9ANI8_PLAOA|nr:PIR Superfamily Protein [Plasmodium ovale wallikeri]SBT58229.1 PIR Superfamily Protein [Plasmodium ovale wallikeri]SBT73482.1 PIR protein [Plasmodium ovale]
MTDDYDNIFGLTSIRCYNQLDKDFVNSGNYEECSKFNNDSDEYSAPYLLCLRLTGNLNNYDKLNFFDELNSYKCNYLNLWAYYQFSKFDENEHSNIRKLIIDNWRESGKFQVCDNTEFLSYLSKSEDYLKAKRLYDYALNYAKLYLYHEKSSIGCTPKEELYIEKSLKLYNDIKTECEDSENQWRSYCAAYREIQKFYPDPKLLNLHCKSKVPDVYPHTGISGQYQEEEEEEEPEEDRRQSAGHRGTLSQEQAQGTLEGELSESSSSDSHKAIGTALPILGFLSIGFILHKFTRFGSMTRNFLRRGRINDMNSHDELPNELLESTYDDQMHPGITETYIGYQAT